LADLRRAKHPKIPILCVVDVATRYTRFFVQERKNDSVKDFLTVFINAVKELFPETASEMLLITDGAPELKINDTLAGVTVHSKISKGINKAVLAEVSIRKARAILREMELKLNLKTLRMGLVSRSNSPTSRLSSTLSRIESTPRLRSANPNPSSLLTTSLQPWRRGLCAKLLQVLSPPAES
jgi:hypothetical protein